MIIESKQKIRKRFGLCEDMTMQKMWYDLIIPFIMKPLEHAENAVWGFIVVKPLEHFLDFSLNPRNIEIPNLGESATKITHEEVNFALAYVMCKETQIRRFLLVGENRLYIMTAIRPAIRLPRHNFWTLQKRSLNLFVNKGTQRKKSSDSGFLGDVSI